MGQQSVEEPSATALHACLREHILWRAGLGPAVDLDERYRSQWNAAFERLMRNRLVLGSMRYGDLWTGATYDCVAAIRKHLDLYSQTGNLEHLVDLANIAMVEFTRPAHSDWHFRATDDCDHAE
jgi:hypothetical protein